MFERLRSTIAAYFTGPGHHRIRHGQRHLRLILRPGAPTTPPPPPSWDELTQILPVIAAQILAPVTHRAEGWLPDGVQPKPAAEGRHHADEHPGRHTLRPVVRPAVA